MNLNFEQLYDLIFLGNVHRQSFSLRHTGLSCFRILYVTSTIVNKLVIITEPVLL